MAEKKKVTFWVGTSGGDGKGVGFLGGKNFTKPQYFTTEDPIQIEALRNAGGVAKEIIEDNDGLLDIAPEKLRALNYEELQSMCEKLHIGVRTSKQGMITEIIKVLTPEKNQEEEKSKK